MTMPLKRNQVEIQEELCPFTTAKTTTYKITGTLKATKSTSWKADRSIWVLVVQSSGSIGGKERKEEKKKEEKKR